jgi:putative membrane protein
VEAGTVILTEEDRADVANAIAQAEAKTSAAIFCLFTEADAYYPRTALLWALAVALLIPFLLWLTGVDLGMIMHARWNTNHSHWLAPTIGDHRFGLTYALMSMMLFVLAYPIALVPPMNRFLTPQRLRRRRFRKFATDQFATQGLGAVADREVVMILISLRDHQADIVMGAIVEGTLPPGVWDNATVALISDTEQGRPAAGVVKAVELVGIVMSRYFPPRCEGLSHLVDAGCDDRVQVI